MIQIPGYLIKREIGAGGMATVHLAVQTSLEREVALKVMNPAMVSDPTFSRRFMQEARTLASLAHPNIVAVYDVGITDEKLHYFSMQHLPHGDFLHRIRDDACKVFGTTLSPDYNVQHHDHLHLEAESARYCR